MDNVFESEFLKLFDEAIAQFNSTHPAKLSSAQRDKTTVVLGFDESPRRFEATLTRNVEHNWMFLYLTDTENRGHDKKFTIETLPSYFETSCKSKIHFCISSIEGWVAYIPKFHAWWRSAASAHNQGRINKASDLREAPNHLGFQLGTYELDAFEFEYGDVGTRYFIQLSYNPKKRYICLTLNDTHNPTFWWNFLIDIGAALDNNATSAISECLETIDGLVSC